MNELVYLNKNEVVCNSLQVAEKFEKEHRNVLQNVDNLIAENSAVKQLFNSSSYKAENGQNYRMYLAFVGKDVAEEDKGVMKCDILGGKQDFIIYDKSDLYVLNVDSKSKSARRLKCWLTSKTLPAIRNNSGYMMER